MPKRKTVALSERRYDASISEEKFLDLVQKKEIKVLGAREYINKTDYDMERNGSVVSFSLYESYFNPEVKLEVLEGMLDVKEQYDALKKEETHA